MSPAISCSGLVKTFGEVRALALVSHPPTLEELFLRHYGDEHASP